MADFAPLKSAEYTLFAATPRTAIPSYKWGGKIRSTSASLTLTSAGATGTATLLRLPAGKIRVLANLSRIVMPKGTATATLDVGTAAYVSGATGLAVAADPIAFAEDLDVGGAAIDQTLPLPAVGYLDLDSADGVDVTITNAVEVTAATGVIFAQIAYTQGN